MSNEVFISYSRRDKVFTQKLYEALKAANRIVWADWDSIPAASDWDAEIKEGIEQTESVLFVLSPEWLKSNECRKELNHALTMGKRLIPILYLMVDPKDVPPELAKINWVYMRDSDDFDKAFQTLCSAMDTDLDWVKMHTRIQVRAVEWDKKKRDNSFALHGKDLLDGEQFISQSGGKSPEPTQLQGEYILASRKDATRRQRITLVGVTIALVISVALGIVAFFQRQAAVAAEATAVVERDHAVSAESTAVAAKETAVAERDRADLNATMAFVRELSAGALNNLDSDPERSTLLALQAVDLTVKAGQSILPDTEYALRSAIQSSRLRQVERIEDDGMYSIAFSPDGRFVAAGSWGGAVQMWKISESPNPSTENRENIGKIFLEKAITVPKANGPVLSIAFSPDGTRMATSNSVDAVPAIWDTTTGKKLFGLPGHTNIVNEVVFNPDGKLLASASDDGTVRLWDMSDGKQVLVISDHIHNDADSSHPNTVKSVAFSPDGRSLASAGEDGYVIISDVQTGASVYSYQNIPRIFDVAFSPDGKTLAWGDDWFVVTALDVVSQKILFEAKNHKGQVFDVDFSPDGSLLASTGQDFKVIVVDAHTGSSKFTLSGDINEISALSFSPDGKYLATANISGETKFWDASLSAIPEAGSIAAQAQSITGLAYSPDGTRIATSGDEKIANIWPVSGGRSLTTISLNSERITDIAFSPDGKQVATGSWWEGASLWDSVSGKKVASFGGNTDTVLDISFSPDGKFLAGGLNINKASMWNFKTGSELFSLLFDPGYYANAVAFSPDGKLFAAGSDDSHIKILETASGKLMHTLGHDLWVKSLVFSPDGTKLLSGSQDNTAILWDAVTGKKIFTLSGHTAGVTDGTFNPDGTLIVTASADGTSKVWDATSGKLLFTLDATAGPVNNVAFSPDGKTLATGSEDHMVRFYYVHAEDVLALAKARITRSLTEQECKTYLHEDKCPDTIVKPQAQTQKPPDAVAMQPLATGEPGVVSQASTVRSGNGTTQVALEIYNNSKVIFMLSWVDFDGVEHSPDTLNPNTVFQGSTYNTHVFRLRDQAGNLILEYVVKEDKLQKIEIAADKTVTTSTP